MAPAADESSQFVRHRQSWLSYDPALSEVGMSLRRLLAVLLLLAAPVLVADAPGVYAIRGGTVHPVSGPAIPNGTVVIRGGLIDAVGANVTVPADATTIDVAGAHVYPGLFDAQ